MPAMDQICKHCNIIRTASPLPRELLYFNQYVTERMNLGADFVGAIEGCETEELDQVAATPWGRRKGVAQ